MEKTKSTGYGYRSAAWLAREILHAENKLDNCEYPDYEHWNDRVCMLWSAAESKGLDAEVLEIINHRKNVFSLAADGE